MTTPLMVKTETPRRGILRTKRRVPVLSGGGNAPPPPREGVKGRPPPPNCDRCVQTAVYEIVLNAAALLRLFLCAHHMRKHWAEMTARNYEIRKL